MQEIDSLLRAATDAGDAPGVVALAVTADRTRYLGAVGFVYLRDRLTDPLGMVDTDFPLLAGFERAVYAAL